jgi:agmatinase
LGLNKDVAGELNSKMWARVMRAPGEGLLTVSAGGGRAARLLAPYLGAKAYKNWAEEFEWRWRAGPSWLILGVPSDSGGGICRGAAHGPLHLREALYHKHPILSLGDLGDIPCIPQLVHDSMLNDEQKRASGESLWHDAWEDSLPVSPLSMTEDFLVALWKERPEARVLTLGGDHSVSGAVFGALSRVGLLKNTAVLHIDAHSDLMEIRFGVQHCFGTWTSHAVRKMRDPQAWVQVGIRTSAHDKTYWESKFGLKQHWAKAVRNKDPVKFAKELVKHWRALGCTRLYITNDIDGTDSAYAASTGTPEKEGLKPTWLRAVIAHCSREFPLISADLMEVAPVLGSEKSVQRTVSTGISYLEALHGFLPLD